MCMQYIYIPVHVWMCIILCEKCILIQDDFHFIKIYMCVCVLQRKRENAFKYFPDYFPDTGIQQKRKITYISLFLSSSLMISHDAAQACILSLGSTEKNPALIHSLWKISFLDIRRKLTHFYELCVLKKNSYFSLS